jgi:hypothetical protein
VSDVAVPASRSDLLPPLIRMKVLLLVTARRICGEDWFNLDGLGWPEIKLIDQTNAMLTLAPGGWNRSTGGRRDRWNEPPLRGQHGQIRGQP